MFQQQASKDGVFKRPDYTKDEIKKKREEAERRARRGEMDVMQEHTFATIAMLSGLSRVRVLQAIFEVGFLNHVTHSIDCSLQDPVILEELDFLYKSDCARRMVFYFQVCPRTQELFPKDDHDISLRRRRRTGRTLQG